MVANAEPIGLVPAGGQSKRMQPYRAWKELIPIGYRKCRTLAGEQRLVPKMLIEYSLENMQNGGARQVLVIINERKAELIRYLSAGWQYGMSLAFVCQDLDLPLYGMPVAISQAHSWLRGHTVFMGMPDTIVRPDDCFARLCDLHQARKADLTLGVFPTHHPNRLAPVMIGKDGRVQAIYDKPRTTTIFNTWNIAVWSDAFTDLLHGYVEKQMVESQDSGKELLLSDVFSLAITEGLKVYGKHFDNGMCQDFGSIDDLARLKQEIEVMDLERAG